MLKTIIKRLLTNGALFLLPASWLLSAAESRAKPAAQGEQTNKSSKGVEFELIDRQALKFRITNHSKRAIKVNSLFGNDSEYPYSPAYPFYEYLSRERWITLQWYGDTFVYPYTLKPGKSVVFEHYYDHRLERLKRGTLVRLRVGDYVSKAFR